MQKKLSITVNAKRYDVDVDEAFATFLSAKMDEDFNMEGNNDLKVLLQAYVKRCHMLYEDEKRLQKLLSKLD